MSFIKRKFAHSSPTFGRTKQQKESHPYKVSLYYLWWEFLRRHDGYKECCKAGGKGKFQDLYNDFGDIHSVDFKTWWQTNDRGANLFAEQVADHSFRILESAEEFVNSDQVLTIQLPLYFPKRYLQHEFKKILDKRHSGRRGIRTNKNSTAMYPVIGHVDTKALHKCLKVYDVWKENPNYTLWQIGQEAKVTRASERITKLGPRGDPEIVAKKAILAITAIRLLKKAKKIIAGTVEGKFPVLG